MDSGLSPEAATRNWLTVVLMKKLLIYGRTGSSN